MKKSMFTPSVLTSAIVAATSLGSAVDATAQGLELEEVLVTAQMREESLMDVPISVSTVDGLKVLEAGITNLEDMTAYVPNLTMNQTGIGTIIAIRGISSGINQGFEQSVGQYIDGIYYGRAQLARAPFMDVERVEILRGPQSILFGKNSIAGAISMTTAKPTDEFEGFITGIYEPDHDERDIRLALSGPLTENLSARLAILDRNIDGYYDNNTLNDDESDEDVQVFRGSLRWHVNDNMTIDLKIEDGSFDNKGRFLEIVNPVGTPYSAVLSTLTGGAFVLETKQNFKRQSNGDSSDNDTENVTLKVDYGIGDYTLTFISGYNAYEFKETCDCDFTGASIFTAATTEDFEQFSQEIRLTSPGGEAIDFIAGLFYQSTELDFQDSINIGSDSLLLPAFSGTLSALGVADPSVIRNTATQRTFDQDSDLWSVFAQATWNINDSTRLTVGARFTDEDKDAARRQFHIDNTGAELPVGAIADDLNIFYGLFRIEPYDVIKGNRSETAFTPLITLQHDLNEDVMLYATYTTGFKGGGFDVRSNAHPDASVVNALRAFAIDLQGVFEFEEEEAQSFEIGAKLTLADGAAELNAALFYTEYDDLQTSQFDGTLGFNVTNAGEATSEGAELDGRWRVTEGLTLAGSIAYLDFEYDKFPNAQCFFGQVPNSASSPGLCDVSGERREFTPEVQASFSADYVYLLTDALEIHATIDMIYSDDYLASPTLDPNLKQDSYIKVNARLSLGAADGQWEVAVLGKNLTDEEVVSFGNTAPLATTLTGGGGAAYYGFFDRPSSVALQATMRF